jgi:PPE-repeat protein
MADPLWFGPPEAIAALLETSDPSTIVTNIAAWLAEAVQHEFSMGASVANIAATLEQWVGLGGAANGLKGSELNFLGLQPLAAHCLKHVAIGHAAVEANILARSTIIPSAVVLENRAELSALVSTNFCGSNTPAITANEATYHGFYHPNNIRAGVMYASTLNGFTGAIGSTPPPVTPAGFAPAEAAAPAETVAESVADDAGSGLTSAPAQLAQAAGPAASSPVNELTSMLQPMQGLLSSGTQPVSELAKLPTQGFQSGASLLQNFMGMSSGSVVSAGAVDTAAVGAAGGPLSVAGGIGGGVGSSSAGAVSAGYSGAGLTSFTRPASTFSPELGGGRATGLKPASFLSAAELRGPTTTAPMGGGMPVSPAAAGMLGRENGGADKSKVPYARIVVNGDKKDPGPC